MMGMSQSVSKKAQAKTSNSGKEDHQTWIKIKGSKFKESFHKQIEISTSKRIFRANSKNDHSSRSHHIFQIKVLTSQKSGVIKESLLSVVDLAGSERLDKPYAVVD